VEDCALELVEGAVVVPTREQVTANACLRRALATRRRQTMAESPPPEPVEDLSHPHVERGSAQLPLPLVGALVPATQEFCDSQFGFGAVRRPTHATPQPDPKGHANDHHTQLKPRPRT
jgi:hypothetical protein